MKRIIAFCILAVMLMSFTSCKREESDDDVAVVDKQNETVQTPADDTGKTQPTTDNTQKEDTPAAKNTQKEDTPAAENTEKEDTPAVEQDKVETKPSEEQETVTTPAVQKSEPCKLTINNTFSDYIVVATLTDAESAKNKTYTPSDFPDLDVFLVFENNDYYNIKYYPEYETKTTLFLMLNTPSKQTVLDYIKLLEKDDRVYSAYGNVIEASDTEIEVTFKDDKQYTADDFSVNQIKTANGITIFVLNERITDMVGMIKKYLSDMRIETALPVYNDKYYEDGFLSISFTYKNAILKTEYTSKDFPGIDIEKIDCTDLKKALTAKEDGPPKHNPYISDEYYYYVKIYFKKPDKQNLMWSSDSIKNIYPNFIVDINDAYNGYTGNYIMSLPDYYPE